MTQAGNRPPSGTLTKPVDLSAVERAKASSDGLRGSLPDGLDPTRSHFESDDQQLLKFHGIYQQDLRDQRAERRQRGLEKAYRFMVRARIPGGRLTADQFLALDDLAQEISPEFGLRLTSRQGLQWHGVAKGELRLILQRINQTLLTTLGACGDVGRNVMLSPLPLQTEIHRAAARVASAIAKRLALSTEAYHEIWLDGEKVDTRQSDSLYGESLLPRKLKLGVTVAGENLIDVFTQDVGLIAVPTPEGEIRFDILIGGGLGMTHRRADTFARLATPLGSVREEDVAEAVAAIAAFFRDHGNRRDRRHARLKYWIEEHGIEEFRSAWRHYTKVALFDWIEPIPFRSIHYLGSRARGDGKYFFGIWVENGRVRERRFRETLREILEKTESQVILTPDQNLILDGLSRQEIEWIDSLEIQEPKGLSRGLPTIRSTSIACPALPTCGLALAESERAAPAWIASLEERIEQLGVVAQPPSVRMTGCPNGCARPYTAEIGLVGRGPNSYDLYVGGRQAGDRLGELFDESVPLEEAIDRLDPLLEAWASEGSSGEGLGDFYWRIRGGSRRTTLRTGEKRPSRPELFPLRYRKTAS